MAGDYSHGTGMSGKKISTSILVASLVLVFKSPVLAQVYINEFSPSSDPEWVELYNAGNQAINLTGWSIKDGHQTAINLSGNIPPLSYFIFENNGWLNNSGGDMVNLYDNATPSANLVDQIVYGGGSSITTPASDKSVSRIPDGSANWATNTPPSKGNPNPNPTPTIQPTPQPSITSLPTPIPTPSFPSPSPFPSPTRRPTISISSSPPVSVTDLRKQLSPDPFSPSTPPPAVLGKSSSTGNQQPSPVVFILPGLVLMCISVVWIIKDLVKNHKQS